jgi:hypothetical protein
LNSAKRPARSGSFRSWKNIVDRKNFFIRHSQIRAESLYRWLRNPPREDIQDPDSEAEFLFVAASAVRETADREGAIPFDITGGDLEHHDGQCSFVSIMREYELKDAVLLMLTGIVNAADTGRLDSNPCAQGARSHCAGLLAALSG